MLTFETLANRYHLTGTIKLLKAVHVGSGIGDEATDSLFVKTSSNEVFIPGSSFRGALRSTVERLLAGLNPTVSCLLEKGNPYSSCPTARPDLFDNFQKKLEKENLSSAQQESERVNFLRGKLCYTCQVFGSLFLGSRVRVSDLLPVNGNPDTPTRYGVGINRDTETAAKGALYTFEVVEPKHLFSFELWAENMEDQDWGVLGLGLLELLAGRFWLGAKGAAGLGQCQLREEALSLEYFEGKVGLKRYLENNTLERKKEEEVTQFLQEKVNQLLAKIPEPGVKAHAEASGQ